MGGGSISSSKPNPKQKRKKNWEEKMLDVVGAGWEMMTASTCIT